VSARLRQAHCDGDGGSPRNPISEMVMMPHRNVSMTMKFHRVIAAGLAGVAVGILAVSDTFAGEVISTNREFMIFRDFKEFKIKKFAKVFFDDTKIYVGRDPKENTAHTEKLREQANTLLRKVLTLVSDEKQSEYTMSIRMEESTNFAIRNAERKPSVGHVSFAICSYPMGEIEDSCQNLTFEFFQPHPRSAVFEKTLILWIGRMLP